jgi:voltage-dependent potassium channel beta subunit
MTTADAITMPHRKLGQAGLRVSTLSLGGWTTFGGSLTDDNLADKLLRTAFDAGVNFFDIADVYAKGESEKLMGKTLMTLPRHRLVISSKVFWPMSDDVNDRGLSRKHIMESAHQSLRRIGTDYLDLYFCHRYDDTVPLEETMRAMDDLVRQGKVLYWGTSEWSGAQLREAHRIARETGWSAPVVEQPQYNLAVRGRFEADVAPTAATLGMGVVTWSPLASGLLTGKYDDGVPANARLSRLEWLREKLLTPRAIEASKQFGALCKQRNLSRTQVAVAFALQHPAVSSVILGATNLAQLQENLGALQLQLDAPLLRALDDVFPADGSLAFD